MEQFVKDKSIFCDLKTNNLITFNFIMRRKITENVTVDFVENGHICDNIFFKYSVLFKSFRQNSSGIEFSPVIDIL